MTEPDRPRPLDTLRAIGFVRTAYREPAQTPIQTLRNAEEEATLVVRPEFAAGLDGLAGFDHAWLITWLDRAREPEPDLHVVPFLLRDTGERFGLFATRAPNRPNPIGLSLIRILGVTGAEVRFRGVDLCDGTPVLDIKPWEQHIDIPGYPDLAAVAAIRGGWYQETGAADRPQRLPHD